MMKWSILIFVSVLVIILIIFLVIQNKRDQKDVEKKLDEDYPKPKHEHIDTEIDRRI